MTLAQQTCRPCRGDTPAVSAADRTDLLREIPDWSLHREDSVDRLRRSYAFASYQQALDFTCKVAAMAEREDHHPRLVLEWGRVTVDWWTHTLGGLHINDFILAARCDELYDDGVR
ncbi:MAG: 4a-hydroxytetrahydrobiopterin dehydratase [Bacteroidales bacterium]|nr:4a-hydroxytetrahydrobiopterin dehydratase [Bacteroidales bacterium]